MNGNDISLIITICVFPFLLLVCAALFVTRFSHPDDDTGIAPKLIAIVLMAFAFTTTIAVPASGANGSGATDISDDVLFQTFSGVTVALVVLVAPFSIFFFNAIFVKYGGDNLSKRIVKSLVGTSVCLAVYLVVLLPIFFSASDRSLSLLEYAIAVMDFIAWFPFCVLLGIGLVALPATLFCYWKYRPSPMQREDYDACRKALGARARQLYASGQEVLKSLDAMNFFSRRSSVNTFVEAVKVVKEDYLNLQVSYQFKGGNPIWPWAHLALSVFCALMSAFWVAAIVLGVLVSEQHRVDLIGIIVSGVTTDGFYFVSLAVTIFFALYLLAAAVFGLLRLSVIVPFIFVGYKMESRNTYADAFLVNAVLLLALSLPVSHLLARVSATQLGDCYVTRFYRDMEASTPFKQFFAANVFYYAVFAASAITAILYFVFPLKQNDKLEKRLEKIKS